MTLVRAARPLAPAAVRSLSAQRAVQRALSRYPESIRPRVSRLAAEHLWLGDLAVAFPGLLAALATTATSPARDRARELVMAGAPLRAAAKVLGIPLWLRRLPPQAFPARVPALPRSDAFACRIANHIPEDPARSAEWLGAVSEAWQVAGEPYALWVAMRALSRRLAPHAVSRRQRHGREDFIGPLKGIGLFAWYSGTRAGPAGTLIREPWHPDLGPTDARRLASAWLERIELAFAMGADGLADVWLSGGEADGFDIVPLCTMNDIVDEAAVMRNCVATYGGSLGEGYCRLWSVRRGGVRVATIEIYRNQNLPVPMIAQMKGPENAEAPPEVWRALYRWLASEPAWAVPTEDCVYDYFGRSAWHRMWLPYWRAMGLKRWLPIEPSRLSLWQMMRTL